jgi:hypothetical protein
MNWSVSANFLNNLKLAKIPLALRAGLHKIKQISSRVLGYNGCDLFEKIKNTEPKTIAKKEF